MKVFVYGTLKKGYGNNQLLEGTKYLGERVLRGFKLYYAGFPVAAPSKDDSVLGEVYEMDDDAVNIRWLDRLESNGVMYHRTKIDDLELYVGDPKFWDFPQMMECPKKDNIYVWNR